MRICFNFKQLMSLVGCLPPSWTLLSTVTLPCNVPQSVQSNPALGFCVKKWIRLFGKRGKHLFCLGQITDVCLSSLSVCIPVRDSVILIVIEPLRWSGSLMTLKWYRILKLARRFLCKCSPTWDPFHYLSRRLNPDPHSIGSQTHEKRLVLCKS